MSDLIKIYEEFNRDGTGPHGTGHYTVKDLEKAFKGGHSGRWYNFDVWFKARGNMNENTSCASCGDTATTSCTDCDKPLCEFCTKTARWGTLCKECNDKRDEGRTKEGEYGADVMPMNNGIMNTKGI